MCKFSERSGDSWAHNLINRELQRGSQRDLVNLEWTQAHSGLGTGGETLYILGRELGNRKTYLGTGGERLKRLNTPRHQF